MKNKNLLVSFGLALAFMLTLIISVPRAEAAYLVENITTGANMTVGSTGSNVVVLQSLLSEMGYLNVPAGVAFGYFGNLTRDAVARYQVAQGVSPAAGYFGPITKLAMHNHFGEHNWLAMIGW